MLDDNVKKNLSTLLTKKTAKRRAKRRPASASKKGSLDQDAAGTSAQEDDPQEAAGAGTNTTTATALSTASGVASPTNSASLGERALLNAALVEDHRIRPLWEIKEEEVALPLEITELFERWKADPSAFLRSDSSQVPTSLTEHYDYALSVRISTISNKILWRFITTAYYDVISALFSQTGIPSLRRRLHSWLLSFASRPRMIEKQSKRISSAGQRMVQRIELSPTRWEAFAATSFIQTLANGCKYIFPQWSPYLTVPVG